jgi:hypothetical protein
MHFHRRYFYRSRPESAASPHLFRPLSQCSFYVRAYRSRCVSRIVDQGDRHARTNHDEYTALGVAVTGFLIYRGISSTADREIRFGRVFIITLVMLGLSLHGIVSTFGAGLAVMLIWAAFVIAAGIAAWRFSRRRAIVAHPDRGVIFQPGSWAPLTLMMGIFFTKYIIGVTLVLSPDYIRHAGFAFAICALYGMFNGIFIGNLLRVVSMYRQAVTALPIVSRESSTDWGSQKF